MEKPFDVIRKAVHLDWDPIGIASLTEEMGEYDNYLGRLCELVMENATEDELFSYLWKVETEFIGLPGNAAKTREFANWLRALKSSGGE